MLISRYSAAVFRNPRERTRKAPSANRPAGTSTELFEITLEISPKVSPSRASSASCTSILISSSGKPRISTLSTPLCSKSSLIFFAWWRSDESGKGPDKTILETVSKNSPLMTFGASASRGKSTWPTAASTSASAFCISAPNVNSTCTTALPSKDEELTFLTLAIVRNSGSSG